MLKRLKMFAAFAAATFFCFGAVQVLALSESDGNKYDNAFSKALWLSWLATTVFASAVIFFPSAEDYKNESDGG